MNQVISLMIMDSEKWHSFIVKKLSVLFREIIKAFWRLLLFKLFRLISNKKHENLKIMKIYLKIIIIVI